MLSFPSPLRLQPSNKPRQRYFRAMPCKPIQDRDDIEMYRELESHMETHTCKLKATQTLQNASKPKQAWHAAWPSAHFAAKAAIASPSRSAQPEFPSRDCHEGRILVSKALQDQELESWTSTIDVHACAPHDFASRLFVPSAAPRALAPWGFSARRRRIA